MFSFSKRECDKLAGNMMSLDLTDDTEKALIKKIFESAIACLNAVSMRGKGCCCCLLTGQGGRGRVESAIACLSAVSSRG